MRQVDVLSPDPSTDRLNPHGKGFALAFDAEPMPLDVIPRSGSALGGTPASELRILAQTSEAPPPRELRVAIDRMFMLPLRRALDAAPPAKRAPSIPPATHRKAARSSAGD